MNQRIQFISDWLSGAYTVTGLCDYYEISRPTAYKWLRRYEAIGLDGLKEQSRRPHQHPHAITERRKQQIIEEKLRHQSWGPKKVMDYLRQQQPAVLWPADSSAGEILKRAGLVKQRRRRRRVSVRIHNRSNTVTGRTGCGAQILKASFAWETSAGVIR